MSVYDLIRSRRTIRRFKAEPVGKEILDRIVDAGRLAPSGANRQPLEFIAVDQDGPRAEVLACLAWAGYVTPRRTPGPGQAPAAYVVTLINTGFGVSGEADAAAAVENMLLTALDEGVGSCWIGSVQRKKLSALLGIPTDYKIDSVLALGYPGEKPVMEEITEPGRSDAHKYWLDDADVLHVPKRRLADVLHRNRF